MTAERSQNQEISDFSYNVILIITSTETWKKKRGTPKKRYMFWLSGPELNTVDPWTMDG